MANYSVVSLFGNRYLIIWANNWQIDIDLFFARCFILLFDTNNSSRTPCSIFKTVTNEINFDFRASKLALTLGLSGKTTAVYQTHVLHMTYNLSIGTFYALSLSLSPHVIYSFINNSSQDIRYGSLFFRMWYRNIPMIMIFYTEHMKGARGLDTRF